MTQSATVRAKSGANQPTTVECVTLVHLVSSRLSHDKVCDTPGAASDATNSCARAHALPQDPAHVAVEQSALDRSCGGFEHEWQQPEPLIGRASLYRDFDFGLSLGAA